MPIEFLDDKNIDELVEIFRNGHAASAWSDYVFDAKILRRNLASMIENPRDFACMYRKNGEIIGTWVASIGTFIFSSTPVGMESGIFIAPEHRGGRAALLMYNEFVKWCDKMGAEPFVEIYFSDNESNQKTYSFFEKVGMKECGKIFRGKKYGLHSKS